MKVGLISILTEFTRCGSLENSCKNSERQIQRATHRKKRAGNSCLHKCVKGAIRSLPHWTC